MKLFNKEIQKFYNKLENGENFSLARFGDGEMIALKGDTIASGCGEWMTNGPEPKYGEARERLKRAFTFKDPGYYVGIACPCCVGPENFRKMQEDSGQEEEQLTYANLFVNSNYPFYVEKFLPLFSKRKVILVANKSVNLQNLPFSGTFVGVDYDAWVKNSDLVNTMKDSSITDSLYLFACGPLGKILAQQLWEFNKNNTYLDIGSTLHPWMGGDKNIRGYYQMNNPYANLVCRWS